MVPALEEPRPARERRDVERRVVEVGQFAEQVLGQRRIGRAAAGEDAEHVGVGALEADDGRVRIARVDRRDVVPARARLRVVARVHHGAPGEPQVACGQRRAVGPDDAAAPVQRDRAPVGGDSAVAVRRHHGRELWEELAVLVVAEHRREQQRVGLVGRRRVRVHRIEAVRFVGEADAHVPSTVHGCRPFAEVAFVSTLVHAVATSSASAPAASARVTRAPPRATVASCVRRAARSRRRAPAARSGRRRRPAGRSPRALPRSRRARPRRRGPPCSARRRRRAPV